MTNTIARLPHTHGIRGRSSGSIYNGIAWVAAVSDKRNAPVLEQAADLFAKLERLLAGVGSDKTRILSATIHLANLADKAVFDEAYADWMGDNPEHWPQRTCMGAELVAGYLVEIMLVAAVRE
jgi:enamine deaminase RidA (YjgF/YER057c/UK114 family)